MSDRDEIIEEMRRCAAENGGSPLGRNAFVRATGIRPASIDKHWLRWSQAVVEAGFTPGVMNTAYSDDYVLETLALLVREFGHYPIANELWRKASETVGFPSRNTFDRFGGKAASMHRLAGFCRARPEFADVLALVGDADDESEPPVQTTTADVGYVYLAKSGRHYKSRAHEPRAPDLHRRPGGHREVLAPAVRPPASQRRMVLPWSG